MKELQLFMLELFLFDPYFYLMAWTETKVPLLSRSGG